VVDFYCRREEEEEEQAGRVYTSGSIKMCVAYKEDIFFIHHTPTHHHHHHLKLTLAVA